MLLTVVVALAQVSISTATIPNRQPWVHAPGTCPPALEGAVFAIAGTNCGGDTTTFDTSQVYGHTILQDSASAAAPCENGRTSGTCFRMWYSGLGASGLARIGYAVSPDGVTWSRVVGPNADGSVLGAGAAGRFDSAQVSFPSVIREGSTFVMWYTGGDGSTFNIGHATSTDGVNWTRSTGPLSGGAVLRISGIDGTFDQDLIAAPRVLRDVASAAAPCENGRTSGTCYRMWYQGVDFAPTYIYRIGYALSPNGLNWIRTAGTSPSGEVVTQGPAGTFDSISNAANSVIRDGAIFRMWYDAVDAAGLQRIGHLISTDGRSWVRPVPNDPVWQGSNDPGTFNPDNAWAPFVIRDGLSYRMWYNISNRPNSRRIGLATVTPGSQLATFTLNRSGADVTINLTTGSAIPNGGSLLNALPASINTSLINNFNLGGFPADAAVAAEDGVLSDGVAAGVARGAIVIRLPSGAAAAARTVSFNLGVVPATDGIVTVQTFDSREVIERGSALLSDSGPLPTATPTSTATSTNTPVPPTNTPVTPTATVAGATATNTPLPPTATNTPLPP
ncbi:MAG TPA: hypothetical protein PKA05_23565, partial [Roseiflexaceae bacterium]|nr:hypothetical protein [Roseiflexaceae bacterium]